jgi:putative ABC transport system permease protein
MYKNFFIVSIRNLSRNKIPSAINILGLAIGMAACLAIIQYVRFEMSYDKFHENADNIYRVTLKTGSSFFATNHPGVGPALKANYPEVKEYARVLPQSIFNRATSTWSYIDRGGQVRALNEESAYNVDPSFLKMFSFPYVYGDPHTAFPNVNSVVISESVSNKFFGTKNPLGEILTRDGVKSFTVTGVFEDVPENSHIKFDILYSYFFKDAWGNGWDPSWDWKWNECFTYIQLDPQTEINDFKAKFPDLIQQHLGNWMEETNNPVSFELQSIKDIHLKSPKMDHEREVRGNVKTIYFLGIIALFILIIAWINYINLTTAKSIERAREVGFRKISGASRKQLIFHFLLESLTVNLLAILTALILVAIFHPYYSQLTGINQISFNLFSEPWFWFGLALTLVLGPFSAGIYPALVLSSFRITSVIKGNYSSSTRGVLFRKFLVGFQFIISIALIAGTFMVYKQLSYMRNKDLGYNKEQIYVTKVLRDLNPVSRAKFKVFRNELKKYPNINSFTITSEIPGKYIDRQGYIGNIGEEMSENTICHYVSFKYDFIETYGLRVLAGRNFREDERSRFVKGATIPVLLNEKAIENLGFNDPEESIDRQFLFHSGSSIWTGEIIGVLNNYHQRSLKEDYDAILFAAGTWQAEYISINVNTSNIHKSVTYVENLYKEHLPGIPFEYFFLDEYFDSQYASDEKFGKVFGVFSLIAIFIASLGLFGLTTYIISKRTKEIAIRKVLGATIQGLLILLSKEFVRLIIIANLFALPVVYFLINNWLDNFAFRISIGWMMFVLPIVILLVIALATTSIQTIKSSLINPANALKYE